MRTSLRVSALAVMAAAMIGASATVASAAPTPGNGEDSGSHQVNICGNTLQENEAEEALAAAAEQTNRGNRAAFCQNGNGNTIINVNPDINVNLVLPEEAANGGAAPESAKKGSGSKASEANKAKAGMAGMGSRNAA